MRCRARPSPPTSSSRPTANDSWSGTLDAPNSAGTDGPFATLDHAQTQVRSLPRSGRTTPITVSIRAGTYFLTKTGRSMRPMPEPRRYRIVYAAYPCETPVVSGGSRSTRGPPSRAARSPRPCPRPRSFAQLWVNDVRRYRPRALAGAYGFIDTPTASGFHFTAAGAFSPTLAQPRRCRGRRVREVDGIAQEGHQRRRGDPDRDDQPVHERRP